MFLLIWIVIEKGLPVMLIYICDDSKSDCLRLMHHLSAYENEIGADFSTVAFSSGDEMFSYLKKHREIPDLFS